MNKMKEYERGREDGLDLALRIVKDGGLEALEREVRFRGITGVHTSLASKDLDKAAQKIKEMILGLLFHQSESYESTGYDPGRLCGT